MSCRYTCMAAFTLATGLRRANVTGLEWSRVDLERRMAHVVADQAKAGRAIGVPLNDDAMAILADCADDHPRFVFVWRHQRIKDAGQKAWARACARRHPGLSLARPAPHLGVMAHHGRDARSGAQRAGGMGKS